MDDSRVAYLCVAETHQNRPQDVSVSPVTIHDDKWAYCPAGANTAHVWQSIMPTPLSRLRGGKHDE